MNNLSATIITLNEEKELGECLKSIMKLVDEIVLVDCGSTDQTLKIAKKFNAKIFYKKFDNFASQKNFALGKASNKWVLSVDADERITKDLAQEIEEVIKSDGFDGYLIPRRNFILGAEIKHTRWSPDKHIWLWKKGKGKWEGEVHEEVKVDGEVGELRSPKLHYQDDAIFEFIKTNNKYATLKAKQLFSKNVKFSFFRFLYDPFYEFLLRFFYKLGFLDGWRGLVLSILMAYYNLQVWVKIFKLQFIK